MTVAPSGTARTARRAGPRKRYAAPDLFVAAGRRVLAKLQAAEGPAARWHGYLALIALAQGEKERFARAHATYLVLPRRPESLEALLSEAAPSNK